MMSLNLLLTTIMAVLCMANNGWAQLAKPLVVTTPAIVDNVVQLRVGDQMSVTVLNTTANNEYRIQRTFPNDRSSLKVTSLGGNLAFPAFTVTTAGEQVITVFEGGDGSFCYSYIINVLPNPRAPSFPVIANLFKNNGFGGITDGSSEVVTTTPALDGDKVYICMGGTVTVNVANTISGHRYRLRQTSPSGGTSQEIIGTGGAITYNPISPSVQPYSIWTVDDRDGEMGFSFQVHVVDQPVAPVLSKSPNTESVCAGTEVSASVGTSGSGGTSDCIDSYEYRVKTGSTWGSWTTYTPGAAIATTGKSGVEIRAKRADQDSHGCLAQNTYTWIVKSLSVMPTAVNISNNNTCQGTSKSLAIEGGSLGAGASWQWYTASCGGTSVGEGTPLSVDPEQGTSTVYYVRAEGDCNTTECASGTVVVNPNPTLSELTATTPTCYGSIITFTATGLLPSVTNTFNYVVKVGSTTVASSSQDGVSDASGVVTFTGTGYDPATYTYEITSITVNGCTSNFTGKTAIFTVKPNPTLGGVAVTPASTVCVGQSVTFTATGLVNGSTEFNYTVQVDSYPPYTGTETKIVTNGTAAFTQPAPDPGSYHIVINSAKVDGCTTNFTTNNTADFVVVPDPTISINGETSICLGASTTLNATTTSGTGVCTLQWQKLTGGIWEDLTGENGTSLTVTPAATSQYRATYSCTGNGCTQGVSNTLTVTVYALPTIEAGANQTVSAEVTTVTMAGYSYTGATGATWQGGAGTWSGDVYTPTSSEKCAGLVVLSYVTSSASPCAEASDNVTVVFKKVQNLSTGTLYTTIQEAIDASSSGNTIQISACTFNERVVINKTLTLQGTSESTCLIDGTGLGNG